MPYSYTSKQIPIELLHEWLICNPTTGELTWRHRQRVHFLSDWHCDRWNRQHASKRAGIINNHGYLVVGLGRIGEKHRTISAHRIVWAMLNNRWPAETIDHINRIKTDNRPANLREATPAQNAGNTELGKRATWRGQRGRP